MIVFVPQNFGESVHLIKVRAYEARCTSLAGDQMLRIADEFLDKIIQNIFPVETLNDNKYFKPL